ncbi:hypothetical protein [Paenibacillus alginolyticus]|uniref:HTH merR-type domain-containing protein n=1 Tax=Paenibacillus alginolyticus TaxID=59839 RepID=A0ABT4G865_9BACL|nr:hypothetical protein [Paenibacillus alginolyticus]MCY9692313.1 hypothetical protein [Paenibacillus alginolyticus]MEC0145846.1 hypothetical protein [Paenibacillus alginolyticus]
MELCLEELLSKANAEGDYISKDTFRSFVRYGLIVPNKKGRGRGRGVNTFYHHSDIEAIHDILTLKQIYNMTSWENMISLLYVKGSLVQWDKLQTRLLKFAEEMNGKFVFISDHPQEVEEAIPNLTVKLKRHEKPRTPSPEEQEAAQQYAFIAKVITDLSKSRGIPTVHALTFLRRLKIFGLPDFKETFEELFGNFELSKLRKSVLACSEADFYRIQQIILQSLKLWSEISALYPETRHVPFFGKVIGKLHDGFKTNDLFSKPEFLQLVVLSLIHISKKRKMELHKFLFNQKLTRRAFLLFRYLGALSSHSWSARKKVK